jgi:hypothetical protein
VEADACVDFGKRNKPSLCDMGPGHHLWPQVLS